MMKVLVTGANGFIGKNLVSELKNHEAIEVFEYSRDSGLSLLGEYCKEADFVFHLAGINRPKEQDEFMEGNFGFTSLLLDTLKKYQNTCPILMSSSIQAELDNAYGNSKKAGEKLLFDYASETGANVYIYRLPNVFGKWCKPNYNSAIATFCHNMTRNIPISVNDPSVNLNLVYIDDVLTEFIKALNYKGNLIGKFYEVPNVYIFNLGEVIELLHSFNKIRNNCAIPDMADDFTKKLYSTYLSYLPTNKFSYELKMNLDDRGSFTEFIKTPDRGQVSVNISKPFITKGNHWHHTKNEKFLVVSGSGVIRFRNFNSHEIIEYFVSGDKFEVVDIPVGYTHNIENLGNSDLVTIMWVNEIFNPEKPDTYFMEV